VLYLPVEQFRQYSMASGKTKSILMEAVSNPQGTLSVLQFFLATPQITVPMLRLVFFRELNAGD